MGEPIRRKSLIDDARFDTYTNIGLHKLEAQQESIRSLSLEEEEAEETTRWTCLVSIDNSWHIGTVIRAFEV